MISPFVHSNQRVLDFGCGDFRVGQNLRFHTGSDIHGIDVIKLHSADLPFVLYEGKKIPYKNNFFDVTYLAFVLHHTINTLDLIKECLRVTKKTIIFLEDVYNNRLELWLNKLFDYSNLLLAKNMHLPLQFKTETEWLALLQRFKPKTIDVYSVKPNPLRPTRHRMFVFTKHQAIRRQLNPL